LPELQTILKRELPDLQFIELYPDGSLPELEIIDELKDNLPQYCESDTIPPGADPAEWTRLQDTCPSPQSHTGAPGI